MKGFRVRIPGRALGIHRFGVLGVNVRVNTQGGVDEFGRVQPTRMDVRA